MNRKPRTNTFQLLVIIVFVGINCVSFARQYPNASLVYVDTAKSLTDSLPDGFSMAYLDQSIQLMAKKGQEVYGYKIISDSEMADFFFSAHINYGDWPNLSRVPEGVYAGKYSISLLIHKGSYKDTVDGRVIPLKAFGEYRDPLQLADKVMEKFGEETLGNSKIIPINQKNEVDNADHKREVSIVFAETSSWDTSWEEAMTNAVFNTFAHYANARNYYNQELLYPYKLFRSPAEEVEHDVVVKVEISDKPESNQVVLNLRFIPQNSDMVLEGRLSAYEQEYPLSRESILDNNYTEFLLNVAPDIYRNVIYPHLSH